MSRARRESGITLSVVSVVHHLDVRSSFREFKGIQASAQASSISKIYTVIDRLKKDLMV